MKNCLIEKGFRRNRRARVVGGEAQGVLYRGAGCEEAPLPPRDKDEQGIEQSHLNATQQTTSKGASPPEHREMEALRVVTYNWLALGCSTGPEAACLCNRRGSMPWGKQEQ